MSKPPEGRGAKKSKRIKRQQASARKGAHGCRSRKRRFRDHAEATRALHAAEQSTSEHRPIRAYECDTCNGWHLTSQPPPG